MSEAPPQVQARTQTQQECRFLPFLAFAASPVFTTFVRGPEHGANIVRDGTADDR